MWLGMALASGEKITLEADDFTLDLGSGARVYRGNVKFRQGDIELDCALLTTHHDVAGTLKNGVCEGQPDGRPGEFRHPGAASDIFGRARRIAWDVAAQRVLLEQHAMLEHAGRRIEGSVITYHIASRRVQVSGDKTGAAPAGERPRLVIPPRPEGVE